MKSLVSIIVPCYNQAQYLDECLQSVLEQNYENWECIIVNDGSPDNTVDVAAKWIELDSRFKYFYQKNSGVSFARNNGISMAIGEFILPLDADDKLGVNYVSSAIDAFNKDNSLKVVYCKAEKFGDEKGEWILNPFSLYNLSIKNMIFCSALYRKKDWAQANGYDQNMTHGLEDWEFWIAMLKDDSKVFCLDIVGFYYRIKENSRNNIVNSEERKYLYEYLNIKHAEFFVKQLGSSIILNDDLATTKKDYKTKLKSKKFVIDLFFKTFFGFTIFTKSDNLN